MHTSQDTQGLNRLMDLSRAISILLLLLHFYHYCQPLLDGISFSSPGDGGGNMGNIAPSQLGRQIFTRIVSNIDKTGLYDNIFKSKLLALFFLVLPLMGIKGRKDERFTYKGTGITIGCGVLLYLGSVALVSVYWLYVLLSSVGFILILTGGTRLSRVLHYNLRTNDPFGLLKAGFPQEERRIDTDFSLHLPAQYVREGQTRESWINVINPRRGVFIMGSPGCGKSRFIIEPLLQQLIQKGFALFLYDFKYDQLSRLAYQYFLAYRDQYPASARFFYINFKDLERSHRCNVLDPSTMEQLVDAVGASRTILLSMNRTWIHRQGEFFIESPINFLAAIIWYLKKYEGGKYCTLPHAIELALMPYDQLFSILNAEADISTLIQPFIEAFNNKTMEMLDGQIASARVPLGRLASPDLYYILTGDDCKLDINDPAAPRILCLGGDPPRQEALAPVLSLYIDRLNQLVNRVDRYKCAIVCDEFATVRAYSMTTTLGTARSNNIVPVLAVQDISQLRTQYTRDEADLFLNISGNLLCGQIGGDTARWVSERIPRVLQDRTTISINSADTSISKSQQWDNPVNPATIAVLSSGEFVGMVSDDPGAKLEMKAFHATLKREEEGGRKTRKGKMTHKGEAPALGEGLPVALPLVRALEPGAVQQHYLKVKADVKGLVNTEMARMMADSDLVRLLVGRFRED